MLTETKQVELSSSCKNSDNPAEGARAERYDPPGQRGLREPERQAVSTYSSRSSTESSLTPFSLFQALELPRSGCYRKEQRSARDSRCGPDEGDADPSREVLALRGGDLDREEGSRKADSGMYWER
jgi:hypothetical protein